MRYGVELRVAEDEAIHAVEPFGLCARRTSRYPLSCASTGNADGAPYHVAGTVPVCGPPRVAKSGAVSVNVATSVEGIPVLRTAALVRGRAGLEVAFDAGWCVDDADCLGEFVGSSETTSVRTA